MYVVVYTETGQQVWSFTDINPWDLRTAECPGNAVGSALISGLRRALEDAAAIEHGRDPERPSERAMRLADEQRANERASKGDAA